MERNKPMATLRLGFVYAILPVMCLASHGQEQKPQSKVKLKDFMRPKLAHSQKLLEGLTLEKFDAIDKEAQSLAQLSRQSEWNVLEDPDYMGYSLEFRRA